ncbi:MAG: universal stress protein [Rhodospirillaceae bacterium]
MAIGTILLHMGNDECAPLRLQVAVELACRFDAFLDIYCLLSPGGGGENGIAASDRNGGIEEEVHRACRDRSYSWHELRVDGRMRALVARSGFADIVVISQAHPEQTADDFLQGLPQRLPLEAPCPVLILPWDTQSEVSGRHILVAWKNCREAGRALREALPFLQMARRVTVLTVGFDSRDDSEPTDLSVYLARNGVEAEFHPDTTSDGDAGDVILAVAHELECDLIVMGAYGHSRLRDMVLDSATHTVLSRMHVPVLMAH